MATQEIEAGTSAQWRSWLKKNHEKEKDVWIIVHKRHTGKPAMTHRQAMEEAICYGWIDTIIKRIDENTFKRCFRKRTNNSSWSTNTLSYAKTLVAEGRMTPAGMRRYKEGLGKKPLDADLPKKPSIPPELHLALTKDPIAQNHFHAWPPSTRTMFLRYILRAKREDTRAKRITHVVRRAHENKKTF